MKGMRNILVYQYDRINDAIIFEVLNNQINEIISMQNGKSGFTTGPE